MHYIQENQYHVIFVRFWCFSMKNFAQIMGLLFGSVGAHTYQKSEQVPPPFRRAEFSHTSIKYFCNIISWHTGFLPGSSFGGKNAIISLTLSIQSFYPVPFTCLILQFCLFRKDFFTLLVPYIFGILAIFDHHVHTKVVNWSLQILCCLPTPAIAGSKILLNFKNICLVILKIFKNLDSKQDSVKIQHYLGSRKNLNFPSCANSSPPPLNNEVS